jgi:hypothetical protein
VGSIPTDHRSFRIFLLIIWLYILYIVYGVKPYTRWLYFDMVNIYYGGRWFVSPHTQYLSEILHFTQLGTGASPLPNFPNLNLS